MIVKDGKKYYTLEESSKILDEIIHENAKKFAKKVIEMQKKLKKENEDENIKIIELENV